MGLLRRYMVKRLTLFLTCFLFSLFPKGEDSLMAAPPNLKDVKNLRIIQRQKDCYVWFEVNSDRYLKDYMLHAKKWNRLGNLMVTARLGNAETILKKLVDSGLNVTGGFKTSDAFDGIPYHDEKAWKRIAYQARRISTLTGQKPVVLENEGAVKRLVSKGFTSIECDRLTASLAKQQWPEIWFWYAPMGEEEPYKTISNDIAKAVMKGIPGARLIEASSAGYSSSPRNPRAIKNLGHTLLLNQQPVSIVYLDDYKKNFWKLSDASTALDHAAGKTVILYPGFDDIGNYQSVINSFLQE